jgi:serine/threonine-protein kinase
MHSKRKGRAVPLTDQTPEPPEGTSAYAQPKPEPALLLGRYRIVEQCGTGGFGRVLVCWDTRLQRRVAIKVIPLRMGVDEASAETTMKEALAEARTSSLLAHPNIVTVYDFESDDHYAYLVMEYVDGLNLAQLLKRVEGGTLTYEECAHLLQSVASALEFAHENGVLHLDIKPSNIMIDRRGQVKLADFGMSTLASAAGWGGARGGTVGFMPPEQIQGMLVDERTDIFSLGVVIWLALCGENPFQAATPEESLKKIFRGAAPSLTENHLELDQNIELVLERTLEPDPTNRLASAELLSKRLVPLLGSSKEGQESLAALVQQAEDGTEDEEAWTERYVEKTPARERFPWLEGALVRTVTALLAGAVLWRILPWVVPADTGTLVLLALAGAGAGAVWPPLGSLAVLGAFVLALAEAGTGGLSMLVALGTAAIGFAWWWAAGRKQKLAGASLLLAPALGDRLRLFGPCRLCAVAWCSSHNSSACRPLRALPSCCHRHRLCAGGAAFPCWRLAGAPLVLDPCLQLGRSRFSREPLCKERKAGPRDLRAVPLCWASRFLSGSLCTGGE